MSAALQTTTVLPPGMHPDEWAARLELAACYRVFAMLGWTEMIYNHITLRLPDSVTDGEKQFLINPFGLHYSEVTARNLVKIDLQGRVLDGATHRVNPAGFVVHAAIHDGHHRSRRQVASEAEMNRPAMISWLSPTWRMRATAPTPSVARKAPMASTLLTLPLIAK